LREPCGGNEDHGVITVSMFLRAELVAAAVVALWVAARFPAFGPRSLRSAMLFAGGAFVVLQIMSLVVAPVARVPHGVYVALFGCVFPTFFVAFLAAAWLMRVLVARLGGSGGGPGHLVPASSR
jgi:hypothetical protein